MHAENYGAIWKHEWINCASSLTQDGSSLLNIQTNLSSSLNIAALSLRTFEKSSLLWFNEDCQQPMATSGFPQTVKLHHDL
jgi:hypothetical protein